MEDMMLYVDLLEEILRDVLSGELHVPAEELAKRPFWRTSFDVDEKIIKRFRKNINDNTGLSLTQEELKAYPTLRELAEAICEKQGLALDAEAPEEEEGNEEFDEDDEDLDDEEFDEDDEEFDDDDDLQTSVEEVQQRVLNIKRQYGELMKEIDQQEFSGESANKWVKMVLDGSGHLRSIQFAPDAFNEGNREHLAATVMDVMNRTVDSIQTVQTERVAQFREEMNIPEAFQW